MNTHRQRLLILLATHNGEKFIQEQLESFMAQTDRNWDLLVSDDLSTDGTMDILRKFKAQTENDHKVTIVQGPAQNSAANFLSLIKQVPKGTELVLFSDQDDVWLPDKLARARRAIEFEAQQDLPILYSAASFICDRNLKSCKAPTPFRKPPSFKNALVQSIGGGNTMALNGVAIRLLQAASKEAGEVPVHDWWMYQLITGSGGIVIRDASPVLYYRQHDDNAIGANTSLRGKLRRMLFIYDHGFVTWNDQNILALNASRHRLTPQARRALSYYAASRHGHALKRVVALYRSGVLRQRRSGTIALYLACLTGRT